MPSFPRCNAAGEGQTARVADRVVDGIGLRGNDVVVVDLAPVVRFLRAIDSGRTVPEVRPGPAPSAFVR